MAVSSVGIWAFHFLVLRGVKEAAAINKIVTIAKIIPLLLFLVLVIFSFKPDVFVANLWGGGEAQRDYGSLFEQVKATMLVTVFVFLGIEGASNYSRFAQKREDVGIATVTGFLGVLALFASVSILSFGILPRAEIAAAEPALGGRRARGRGRPLGRDVHRRRRDRLGARRLPGLDADGRRGAVDRGEEGRHAGLPGARRTPTRCRRNALLMSTLLVQLVLIATLFSDDAFTFALSLCSHLSLLPYLLSAAFLLKLVLTRETYDADRRRPQQGPDRRRPRDRLHDLPGRSPAGMKFLVLLGFLIYAPGTLLYLMTRREQGKQVFTPAEWIIFAVVVVGAVVRRSYGLVTGYITI